MPTRSESPCTEFAPAERTSRESALLKAGWLAGLPFLPELTETVPNPTMILNRCRQIVACNRATAELLEVEPSSVIGMRPGEALKCVHAGAGPGGCGTSHFCSTCGMVAAILASQEEGRRNCRESRLLRRTPAGEEGLDLRVWASPLFLDGEPYSILSIADIGDEKRRQALERVFFHDVLNTAGGLLGLSELLLQSDLPPEPREIVELMDGVTQRLLGEIQSQRTLTLAENGDLRVDPVRIRSLELLEDVAGQYRAHDAALGKEIALDPEGRDVEFVSDRALVGRVLGNLLKNALEASAAGDRVTLSCGGAGDSLELRVHNPAVMEEGVRLQVFKRSFSTKGVGRGLGTYGAKLLTERYLRGRLRFTSSEGEGTTFVVRLPIV